jgi:flavin reductase (DIM6/NTAB) family NADH-FMN oxidoreductase RutF
MPDPDRTAGTAPADGGVAHPLELQFKGAMRRLASGVALITTAHAGRRYGMAATAVSSLSMDPPALTISINRGASMYEALVARGEFCVNILQENHAELCRSFNAAAGEDRFRFGCWQDHACGLPYLADCQAAVICRTGPTMTFATHTLFVGEVTGIVLDDKVAPLVYLDGGYFAVRPLV